MYYLVINQMKFTKTQFKFQLIVKCTEAEPLPIWRKMNDF